MIYRFWCSILLPPLLCRFVVAEHAGQFIGINICDTHIAVAEFPCVTTLIRFGRDNLWRDVFSY